MQGPQSRPDWYISPHIFVMRKFYQLDQALLHASLWKWKICAWFNLLVGDSLELFNCVRKHWFEESSRFLGAGLQLLHWMLREGRSRSLRMIFATFICWLVLWSGPKALVFLELSHFHPGEWVHSSFCSHGFQVSTSYLFWPISLRHVQVSTLVIHGIKRFPKKDNYDHSSVLYRLLPKCNRPGADETKSNISKHQSSCRQKYKLKLNSTLIKLIENPVVLRNPYLVGYVLRSWQTKQHIFINYGIHPQQSRFKRYATFESLLYSIPKGVWHTSL